MLDDIIQIAGLTGPNFLHQNIKTYCFKYILDILLIFKCHAEKSFKNLLHLYNIVIYYGKILLWYLFIDFKLLIIKITIYLVQNLNCDSYYFIFICLL